MDKKACLTVRMNRGRIHSNSDVREALCKQNKYLEIGLTCFGDLSVLLLVV